MKVLSTRILSASTIKYAETLGLQVDCVELVSTRRLEFNISEANENIDAVVFTSGNAVKYFFPGEGAKDFLIGKKIFSISGKTKADMREFGFTPDKMALNASALGDTIVADEGIKSVLHVCGNLRLGALEDKIREAGKSYFSLVVYETLLNKDFVQVGKYDAIMFYSPSGVEAYCAKNKPEADSLYTCIGNTTSTALKAKNGNLKVLISKEPSPEAMIELIAIEIT